MKRPLHARPLTQSEQFSLQSGLRSSDAFVVRRCQIILASSHHQSVEQISKNWGGSRQGIRNILHAFNNEGLIITLSRKSNRPRSAQPTLDESKRAQLRQILEQSPRTFGKESSLWTLSLLAQIIQEQGLSIRVLSIESVRIALKRLGLKWKRAKSWITSPDRDYSRKKSDEID